MAARKLKKKRSAEPITYEVTVYRVNGVITLPVTTDQGKAMAREEAVRAVREGVRAQEGGPRISFGEVFGRVSVLAVLERDATTDGQIGLKVY